MYAKPYGPPPGHKLLKPKEFNISSGKMPPGNMYVKAQDIAVPYYGIAKDPVYEAPYECLPCFPDLGSPHI